MCGVFFLENATHLVFFRMASCQKAACAKKDGRGEDAIWCGMWLSGPSQVGLNSRFPMVIHLVVGVLIYPLHGFPI